MTHYVTHPFFPFHKLAAYITHKAVQPLPHAGQRAQPARIRFTNAVDTSVLKNMLKLFIFLRLYNCSKIYLFLFIV